MEDYEYLYQLEERFWWFAGGSFDLVTSFDVLVQIPGEGADEQAMRKMFRALKPGGIAFVRCAAYEWMKSGHDRALGTQRRCNLEELTRKLRRAGFAIPRETYANSLLFPIAAMRRLALKRLGLADSDSDVKPLPPHLDWLNRAAMGSPPAGARECAASFRFIGYLHRAKTLSFFAIHGHADCL
jgi:SAM-dependent methyltransferase